MKPSHDSAAAEVLAVAPEQLDELVERIYEQKERIDNLFAQMAGLAAYVERLEARLGEAPSEMFADYKWHADTAINRNSPDYGGA
jgi:hypothetical protein